MSNERPSDHTRIAGSFEGKLSSLHLSRTPTPSSIDMDSSDNSAKWVTGHFVDYRLLLNNSLSSVLPPNIAPVIGVNYAPTTGSTEAPTVSPPISAPASSSIPAVPVSIPGPETPLTVSDHVALTIVATNYWSFSICLRSAGVYYRPLHLIPSCKQPRFQNRIPLWVTYTSFVLGLCWWSADSEFWLRFLCKRPEYTHQWRHFCKSFMQVA